MTKNRAKQRMLEGKPSLGTVAALGSPLAAELISRAGFDVILVDNQHGAWDDAGSALAFRSIWLGATVPMVRVPANDFGTIGRLLDRGALGIIVPLVESADEARAAAYAARYPPRGGRSWWPLQAGFYGSDYDRWIDDELFLAVQIESVRGVEHASEILAVEGVDGCWVGPTDLALSMGVDSSSPEGERALEAAIARVLEACRAVGTIPGIHCGDDAARRIDQGFLFVTTGSDTLYLERGAQETLRNLGRLRQRQGS
jgi:4-hydroxy-2-oxoheptanedioate aldolase